MRRTDFTEIERRRLGWERRHLCRDVGRAFDGLVDLGEPPDEMVAELTEVMARHTRLAIERRMERRAA